MRSVEGRYHGNQVLIQVGIIGAVRWVRHRGQTQEEILEGVNPYRALIDTGATSTMISPRVVSDLRFESSTRKLFRFLEGEQELPAHTFYVAFNPPTQIPESNPDKKARSSTISVCSTPIIGGVLPHPVGFDVLLGMDVISTGTLILRPGRRFSFTFGP